MSWNNHKVGVAAGPLENGARLCRLTLLECAGADEYDVCELFTPTEVRELIEHLEPFAAPKDAPHP